MSSRHAFNDLDEVDGRFISSITKMTLHTECRKPQTIKEQASYFNNCESMFSLQ